jgi:hypothetical protein
LKVLLDECVDWHCSDESGREFRTRSRLPRTGWASRPLRRSVLADEREALRVLSALEREIDVADWRASLDRRRPEGTARRSASEPS